MFARFAARDPDPKTELHYGNPYTLLIAVVLSAQATDASVNQATPALFAAADTAQKMVALGEKAVIEKIKTIGQPTIAIDTHMFRVSNRTGLAPGKTPLKVEETLERVVPEHYKHNCHHWLILHGRYVCKARKPECWRCIIADICVFKPKMPAPA
jgi:endonuclease-3